MPRPGVGNPGNSGGKPYSQKNREKAATLKGLVMDWAIKVMGKKDSKNPITQETIKRQKELVISKILPTCVPRPVELTGQEGEPIKFSLDGKTLKLVDDFISFRKKKV